MGDNADALARDPVTQSEGGVDAGQVVYESESSEDDSRRRRMFLLALMAGMLTVAVVMVFSDEQPIPFGIGAVLLAQLGVITLRAQRLSGPVLTDQQAKSRISPILSELCHSANCALPIVSMRRAADLVSVHARPRRKQRFLHISPDFLAAADDAALRAILAHEVVHLSGSDLAAAKSRWQFTFLIPYAGGLAAVFTVGHKGGLVFAFWIVFLFPTIEVFSRLTGFSSRRRETNADLLGAAAIGDPDAMIRGLEIVYRLTDLTHERLYGRSIWKWMFFPFCLRATTHRTLAVRSAHLRTLPVAEPDAL